MVIFEKCSFDQPPLSHPSPLRASDKLSPSSKTTYSETTRWLQQSQKNVDHFWKKDTALVKALRQYHFTSGALEGQTQWKFQKSRILHKVLDVIALNMESTGRCLDFRDSMPVDQEFWHWDTNLRHLKAVAVKEVEHLTMVLVLDEDHTHYSDAFGNIFESGALSKKRFPEGSDGIKTKKGGPARAIVCHFCLHACSNDDYAYHHLAAIHLNIQWGCGACYGYVSGYLLKIREHMSSLTRRGAPKSDPTHPARRRAADIPIHPRTGCQVMRRFLRGNQKKRKRTMMMKSTVPPVGLAWTTRISTRIPTRASHGNEL